MIGAGFFAGYQLLWDFFTHHAEAAEVPNAITHAKIWAVLIPIVAGYVGGPGKIFIGYVAGYLLIFPLFLMLKNLKSMAGAQGAHIFYQKGVSQAERDVIEYKDYVESMGFYMEGEKSYGYKSYQSGEL